MNKWKRLGAAFVCAAALMTGSAFAHEARTADVNAPAEDEIITTALEPFSIAWAEGDEYISLFAEQPAWEADDTRYGDVLTGVTLELYEELDKNFPQNAALGLSSQGKPAAMCTVGKTFEATGSGAYQSVVEQMNVWTDEVASVVFDAAMAYTYDHPEFYWIRTDYAVSFNGSIQRDLYGTWAQATRAVTIEFHTPAQCTQTEETDALVGAAVESILKACEDLPTVGKLAYFDRWLAMNNVYNTPASRDPNNAIAEDARTWSILSGLLSDLSPVCEGYAKTFQLLCHKSGIPCVTLSGSNHMWNAVQVDGLWYVVDATFNDQGSESTRSYFLIDEPTDSNHGLGMRFPTPPIAEDDWRGTWRVENGAIRHGETFESAPTPWFALYNADGKLIELKNGHTFTWTSYRDMCVAPAFDAETLKDAARIELFYWNESFVPYKASTPIE
ncbi:MAG: hypothetical protein IJ042_07820 [Butyricicoccus sp.]|nr:hypothetical protein [Butyricicoccus sp.]